MSIPQLYIPYGTPPVTETVPMLSATNWIVFKFSMEMFFIGTCASYLLDSTPSTIIPPECSLLDQELLIHLWSRIEDEFRPLLQIEKKSTLLAWTNLTSNFQKLFPVNQKPYSSPSPPPSPPVVKDPIVVKQPPSQIVVKQLLPTLPISSNLMDIPPHPPISHHPVTSVPSLVLSNISQVAGQLQDLPSTSQTPCHSVPEVAVLSSIPQVSGHPKDSSSLPFSPSSRTELSSSFSRNSTHPYSSLRSQVPVSSFWTAHLFSASRAFLLSLSAETMHFSSPLPFCDNG